MRKRLLGERERRVVSFQSHLQTLSTGDEQILNTQTRAHTQTYTHTYSDKLSHNISTSWGHKDECPLCVWGMMQLSKNYSFDCI